MSGFADRNQREQERPGVAHGTIEIGRASTRRGMIVRIDGLVSGIMWRAFLERTFDLAGRTTPVRPHDAGWWVCVIGAAAIADGLSPCALRPGEADGQTGKHVFMVLEPQRMLERAPAWPLVRLAPTTQWLDLRGETCLAHGPGDSELAAYAERVGAPPDVVTLREMFELGVLQWSPAHPDTGRREVVRAR